MPSHIILNNQLLEMAQARVSPLTAAALYGRGVFTTIAVHGGRPFLWPQHWARLLEHADRLRIERAGLEEAATRAALMRLLEANAVAEGRARLTLLARAGSDRWKVEGDEGAAADLLMITGEARVVGDEGLALTLSPFRANSHSPLAGVKSINYLDHLLSWEEARSRDFDEAVVLNERGEIVSATMANIFWVKDGALHTPALSTGALAGTTRACVIELAEEIAVPLVEGVYELAHLNHADEIFLTSAGLGVAIVTTFDFHHYSVPVGSVALRLREALRQLTLHAD